MECVTSRPHDLLRLSSASALSCADDAGTIRARTVATVGGQTWVVVRRAEPAGGRIPVGIRGAKRSERYAATVAGDDVVEIVSPAQIHAVPVPRRARLRAFRALAETRRALATHRFDGRWGPGGSVGFELVTGAPTVRETSDLDIVIDAPAPLSRHTVHVFLDALADCPARVDVQVATPLGGFALREWLRDDGGLVALRTSHGPVLTASPWG